ncbi:Holliday junction branch migration protein RuvA [Natranaerobius thermophilus]|uniref:Holliday junction branch migration complex subunit RuvA n=1 Tax=Natranaerobius thermophilus (strain ATCC BAA-1301 / DSM 18059 / JW/NM-WN-LF) TaxID=457570 RepID=RUVA_NATTJ|nr:Holliday junction branch migration protein RuvA [Natranaerobius thermophilus]B2A5L5.1 RecName: Full=Holliday junction branch migration complex subunit RuvA [Natranaerobius thermophilus JW/NM-WN-LF]ACB85369.1 Holliday junction DNA helicase RuvA [Natranaerobius thermophilus JW/NM-WN-LF]
MITRIRGEMLEITPDYCVVMAGGLGYKIYIPDNCQEEIPDPGQEIDLHTYLSVREDAMTLYGFTSGEQLAVFELIMNVSGIGPKIALALVGTIPPTEFYLSVLNDQVNQLTKVPGIGKKSAQRIILELKEKVKDITSKDAYQDISASEKLDNTGEKLGISTRHKHLDELKAALSSLGYTNREIEKTVDAIQGQITEGQDMEELLRLALQKLNTK